MEYDIKINTNQHYLTGIPGIDKQHNELFEKLDGLIKHLKNKSLSAHNVRAAILDIFNDFKVHFTTEEAFMEMVNFPGIKDHVSQHRNLLNVISGEMKILENTDNLKIGHFIQSYRNMAQIHLDIFDREYVEYARKIMAQRKKKRISILKKQLPDSQSIAV